MMRCSGLWLTRAGAAILALALALVPAAAQQLGLPESSILTLSAERLYAGSAFGRRVQQDIEAESAVLAAENRRMEAELSVEEQDLTDRRATMEPIAFRTLADAFDKKVQDIRRIQDAKARELGRRDDIARSEFLKAARPILEALMREAGATLILERASVFLSANSSDVTDLAIGRIDAVIGDGVGTVEPTRP
jgi:Skp family chaperone for outer membrane proteins